MMTQRHNVEDWLAEYDIPAAAAQPDSAGGMQSPMTDPNAGGDPTQAQAQANDPNISQQPATDVTQDPQTPDMPETAPETKDFETWKNNYLKESVKGDTNALIELIHQIRDKEGLQPYQRKFVEDNLNVQLVRMNSNVEKASKDIRRQIREQLDRNNPATSVVNHMSAVLETQPSLINTFIKLNGYSGQKGDLHRKYIAALLGAVQVGSGANNEDLIFNEKEYSILISTRLNARWGDVMLGYWSLREDDPEKFLTEPELKRLTDGSPEEREALRCRVVIEPIAQMFETRAFLVNVVADDGTVYTLGWDIATSLRAAFLDGKLVVKMKRTGESEALIDSEGNIVPLMDLSIVYTKETGQQDEEGKPEKKEIEFIERKDGMLFLSASLQTIRDATTALQGAVLKETPYAGNPSDLVTLQRCVYSSHDLLMRSC